MPNIKSNPAKTMLTICTGLLIIGLVRNDGIWWLRAAALLGVLGISSDYLSKKIEFLWHKIAWLLGQIVPNIILSVIFFACILPLSMLRRLFSKKDLLMLKNRQDSTYVSAVRRFEPGRFEELW